MLNIMTKIKTITIADRIMAAGAFDPKFYFTRVNTCRDSFAPTYVYTYSDGSKISYNSLDGSYYSLDRPYGTDYSFVPMDKKIVWIAIPHKMWSGNAYGFASILRPAL
jgi:hypothetical protein